MKTLSVDTEKVKFDVDNDEIMVLYNGVGMQVIDRDMYVNELHISQNNVLDQVRQGRGASVAVGAVDSNYNFEVGIGKFQQDSVVSVDRGGTGLSNVGVSNLIIGGKSSNALEVVRDICFSEDWVKLAGKLTWKVNGSNISLTSTVDEYGMPELSMMLPGGDKGNAITPTQSRKPKITDVIRKDNTYEVHFGAYNPISVKASAFSNAQVGEKTSYEVLRGYGAYNSNSVDVKSGDSNVEVSLETHNNFVGSVAFVVKDGWGNVSQPHEIQR